MKPRRLSVVSQPGVRCDDHLVRARVRVRVRVRVRICWPRFGLGLAPEAHELDAALDLLEQLPLHGVPVSVVLVQLLPQLLQLRPPASHLLRLAPSDALTLSEVPARLRARLRLRARVSWLVGYGKG